ncbi:ROK family protein [Arthrobacter sp. AOP36-C1-22]|uniref:ROK family protein n=1 Tax=Arthrobacter sp. AOP36-C1-22 TaxID=3457683 RepID=UPI00403353E7
MRLGIDIGGTKTAAAIIDDDGALMALRSAPSGYGPEAVIAVAASLAREVLAVAAVSGQAPTHIGACMPGLVDPATGVARHAVNLGVELLDLAGGLGAELGQNVDVENDVKAAALGAHHLLGRHVDSHAESAAGSAGHRDTLAYLNIGTGLAAALVLDGQVLRGPDGSLGEIGHLPMGGDIWCGCGQRGCLETLVSGSALARMWPWPSNPFDAAARRDPEATAACARICAGLFLAVQLLVLTTGADRIVLGGGLTSYGRDLEAGLHAEIDHRARMSDFVAALSLVRRVELLPADMPAAVVGAALLNRPIHPGRSRPGQPTAIPQRKEPACRS